MFSPEETTQTTKALGKLPHALGRGTALNERRQHILQQKQTDALPSLGSESPSFADSLSICLSRPFSCHA